MERYNYEIRQRSKWPSVLGALFYILLFLSLKQGLRLPTFSFVTNKATATYIDSAQKKASFDKSTTNTGKPVTVIGEEDLDSRPGVLQATMKAIKGDQLNGKQQKVTLIGEEDINSNQQGSFQETDEGHKQPSAMLIENNCSSIKLLRKKKGRIYFLVPQGEITKLTSNKFFDGRPFFDCYSAVKKKRNGPFEIVDSKGNVITNNIEDYKAIREFHEGLAGVFDHKKRFAGYINIHARLVINLERIFPGIDLIEGSDFVNGKAYLFKKNGGFLLINAKGNIIRETFP